MVGWLDGWLVGRLVRKFKYLEKFLRRTQTETALDNPEQSENTQLKHLLTKTFS